MKPAGRISPDTVQGFACILGGFTVIIGAFGAHALKESLLGEPLDWFRTAVTYQFWHVIALWFAGDAMRTGRTGGVPALCFAIGILLFSGSLYAMAITEVTVLGMITPVGGLAFIVGWALLARSYLHGRG